MNASQRRLLVWGLVVAAVVAHFYCWPWAVGRQYESSHWGWFPLDAEPLYRPPFRRPAPTGNLPTEPDEAYPGVRAARRLEDEWRKSPQGIAVAEYDAAYSAMCDRRRWFGVRCERGEVADLVMLGFGLPLALIAAAVFVRMGGAKAVPVSTQ
jgi:hypothetical protein